MSQVSFVPLESNNRGNTWYVSPSGSGGDCSQANPCQIDNAVQLKSSSGDTILAKSGTYLAPHASDSYIMYIYKSLHITGSCEWSTTGPVICHPDLHSSFLNAQSNMRGIAIQGLIGDGMSVVIEGFTIYGGNAESVGPGDCVTDYGATSLSCGGGIFAERVDHLEIRNNEIWANHANNNDTTPKIGLGGGVYAENVGDLVIKDNIIKFNCASGIGDGYGGGIFIIDAGDIAGVIIENNLFDGNELSADKDLMKGAGLLVKDATDVQINRNEFYWQGNIHDNVNYGSSIYMMDIYNSYIHSNFFHQNYGMSSIRIDGSGRDYAQVVISGNRIIQERSALNIEIKGDAEVMLLNNFIGANDSDYWESQSAGIHIKGESSIIKPGVILGYNTFALSTFGLWVDENTIITVEKNIFTQISEAAVYLIDPPSTTFSVNENLFHDNVNDGVTGTSFFTGNPLLVDAVNGDFHIQPGSAAIDKVYSWQGGIDIDGQIRPVGVEPNSYDVGADEYMLQYFLPIVLR